MHFKNQNANIFMIDMWWLAGALFLVCIIEVCERLQFFSTINLTHT